MKCIRGQAILSSLLMLCAAMLLSCGNNGSDPNGYIRISLEWPGYLQAENILKGKGISRAPSGNVCQDYLIQTINVNIYTTGNSLVTSKSFPCSDHAGFVPVQPGSYNMVVDGTCTDGATDWRGQHTGVTVTQGSPTDAPVAMTYIGPDTVKPTVAATTPANGATGVSVASAVTAVFSEDMAAFSIDTASFLLTRGTVTVTGTVSYTSAFRTASFLPSSPLSAGSEYTAKITTGAKDLAMNALAAAKTWNFTTASDGSPTSSLWDSMIWDTGLWN